MVGTGWTIVIVVLVFALVAAVGWVIYSRFQAQKLGLPPPSFSSFIPFRKSDAPATYGPPQPAPGGIQGWINDRIRMFKNRNNRSAAGAYEGAGTTGRGRGGFGPLDPDEAWDTRVGNEADTYGPGGYYEEQELGLAPQHNSRHPHGDEEAAYGGASDSYHMNLAATPQMPPAGYGEDVGQQRGRALNVPGGGATRNPFDDDAEPSNISLRGVSPRPIETDAAAHQSKDPGDSPSERRSVFRENM